MTELRALKTDSISWLWLTELYDMTVHHQSQLLGHSVDFDWLSVLSNKADRLTVVCLTLTMHSHVIQLSQPKPADHGQLPSSLFPIIRIDINFFFTQKKHEQINSILYI